MNTLAKAVCLLLLSTQVALAATSPEYLPEPNSTESAAIRVGNTVYISGQASGDINTPDETGAALEESLQKIKNIANQMGGDMQDIVKLDIYLVNFDRDFPLFDQIFNKYFSEPYATRTAIGVPMLSGHHTVAINAIMRLHDTN